MMSYPYFDGHTFIIYFFFGCLCVLSIHIAKGGRYSKDNENKGFLILFFSLFIFAVFRKIGLHLGGEDALRYQDAFINYFNHGAERFKDTDILFGLLIYTIRSISDNPFIYRGVCYGLIIYGYIEFIKTICPQKVSPIPFICILVPFMRSMNTMRSSMSIALILFSLVCYYKKKYLGCVFWAVTSVLTHRLSFAMLSIFPFIFLARKYLVGKSKIKIVVLIVLFIIASYLLSTILQQYIILFNLFSESNNADLWYLTHNQGKNLLLNWPMYLPHILLFMAFILQYYRIKTKKNPQIEFILTLFYFDIIILPATLVLGLWRFQEYLYIPNLILWAYILPLYYTKIKQDSRIILRSICFIAFTGLMLIRLSREWEEAALMPYLFFWQ